VGPGKTALVARIILWAMLTEADTRGVVTANTESQLRTKTWAELAKWFRMCPLLTEFFILTATTLAARDRANLEATVASKRRIAMAIVAMPRDRRAAGIA
jgi:hypothetical protein